MALAVLGVLPMVDDYQCGKSDIVLYAISQSVDPTFIAPTRSANALKWEPVADPWTLVGVEGASKYVIGVRNVRL